MAEVELVRLSDKKTIEVYFLDDFMKRIHEDIFGKDLSWANSSYTNTSLKEFLTEKELEGAKKFLLRKLSRKALLKSESSHLLQERSVDEESISLVLSQLENLSLYDDAHVLESKIRSRMRKNLGKDRIKRDLWSQRVPEEQFEDAFTKVESEENTDPVSQVLAVIKKSVKEPLDYQGKQRLMAKLMRRGFERDDIYEAFKKYNLGDLYD